MSPYSFDKMPQELIDFKDNVTQLLNFGKYQNKVLIEGTPTWTGKEGEYVWSYLTSATAGWYNFYQYFYVNSAWRFTIATGQT